MNLYGFVRNNPTCFADSDGRSLIGDVWGSRNDVGFFGGAWNWFTDGHDVHVPFEDYDPGWGAWDFDGFDGIVRQVCGKCPSRIPVDLTRGLDLYAEGGKAILLKGGPGRITVRLKGFIGSFKDTCPCNWVFRGDVSIDRDPFNFDNPLDPGRTGLGTIITTGVWTFQHVTSKGHDFYIYFDGSRFIDVRGTCPPRYQDAVWIPAG